MNLFDEIADKHPVKEIQTICSKLRVACSFDSGKDAERLCKLAYLLYVLDDCLCVKELAAFTHEAEFPGKGWFRVWDFILPIWGLEAYVLMRENNPVMAEKRIKAIQDVLETPTLEVYGSVERQRHLEEVRRANIKYENSTYAKEIENAASRKSANNWRLVALYRMMGYTVTGLYPDLLLHEKEIEKTVDDYVHHLRLQYGNG